MYLVIFGRDLDQCWFLTVIVLYYEDKLSHVLSYHDQNEVDTPLLVLPNSIY